MSQLHLSHPGDSPQRSHQDWLVAIYRAYPRRIGYRVALEAIDKALGHLGGDYDYLLTQAQAYAKAMVGQEVRFIPHPATWFNQQRYMDDIEDPSGKVVPILTEEEKQIRAGKALKYSIDGMAEHEVAWLKLRYPTIEAMQADNFPPAGPGDLRERIRRAIA